MLESFYWSWSTGDELSFKHNTSADQYHNVDYTLDTIIYLNAIGTNPIIDIELRFPYKIINNVNMISN